MGLMTVNYTHKTVVALLCRSQSIGQLLYQFIESGTDQRYILGNLAMLLNLKKHMKILKKGGGLQPPIKGLPGPDQCQGKWQDSFTIQFTWDYHNATKKIDQAEGMLLIIPLKQDETLYSHSQLLICTAIMYYGKDSKEMAQEI
jgi:hypothetical protein